MRRVTRLLRKAALAVAAAALAGPLGAQTPTPTPTATPVPSSPLAASVAAIGIPNGGRYDASNMILKADGTIWTASANENVIARISPDGSIRKWTMPKDAAPSHLLEEPDGTFWVAQLGGFKVSKFDPEKNELTEWADAARRPTAFVKKADGTLWLPETNGVLTTFNPATNTFDYRRTTDASNPLVSLAYPFLDADGSVWAGDFVRGGLVRIAPDGLSATRWQLPNAYSQPSKIIRGPDGALWISLYAAAQLARFDPATAELKSYTVGAYVLPFDMKVYKDRIAYTEQFAGEIGVFDAFGAPPASTDTLESTTLVLESTVSVVEPVKTTLTTTDVTVEAASPALVDGFTFPGVARYQAISGSPYALVVDDVRKRFLVGATAEVTEVLPPVPVTVNDHYYPAAASIGGAGGNRWATQVIGWNLGTAASDGTTTPAAAQLRLMPTDWIIGNGPTATMTVGPGKIVSWTDPIAEEMGSPDTAGALRLAPTSTTATNFADFYSWARVYRTRADGGTYGMARNRLLGTEAIAKGETGILFAPPDGAAQRTNVGLFVVEATRVKVSLVDEDGTVRGGPAAFDWPAGYQAQASTVFDAFGVPPIPSARIVFEVETGRILPFGSSIDVSSGDPIDLPFFGPRSAAAVQWVLGVERGGGPLGPTSRTDLQLFNPGTTDATVTLGFRAAHLSSEAAPSGGPPFATVTVPAGRGLTVRDAVKELFGLESVAGSIDVVTDPPVYVFARVTAEDSSGGRHGYGFPAVLGDAGPVSGGRGIFIQAADAGYDVMESELQLTNPTDSPANVTVKAWDSEGNAAGTPLALTLAPKEVVRIPAAFYGISGIGAPVGRLEVLPADGAGTVFACYVRQDRRTGDADAVVPYVKAPPASS